MTTPTLRLLTLGALDLQTAEGSDLRSVLAQPRRVALLVYLALATPRGPHRRDRLLGLFWPDQDQAHARNALSQAVYFLRGALGADAIVSRTADELALDSSIVWCDAIAFNDAVAGRRYHDAVELYRGELLAGFHVSGVAPEFSSWLDNARGAYASRYAEALTVIAAERETAGDLAGAVAWRRRVAAHDPLSSEAALQLMRALAAGGDPAAAIRHARVHETLLRQELDTAPDERITQLVKTLQSPQAIEPLVIHPRPVQATAQKSRETENATAAEAPSSTESTASSDSETILRQAARPRAGRRRYVVGATLGLAVAVLALFAFTHTRASDLTSSCVAVMPLANYSGDRSQDDLADAMTDALITELAHYQRLGVISRTSVFQYKGSRKPLPAIARELDCGVLIEGSIARSGNRVMVDAQLVDALADRHLWAERYDREITDLPTLEREVADAVALQLGVTGGQQDIEVTGAPARASARRVDPINYALYLRGREAALSRDPAGLRRAIALYQEAIRRDSSFALAYSGLADAYHLVGAFGYMGEDFVIDSAPKAARMALALDPGLSESHASVAASLTEAGDWAAAEREYRRAVQLTPSNALAHYGYSVLLITLGRKQEALIEIRRARQLDPLSQPIRGMATVIETYAGVINTTGHPLPRNTAIVDPNDPRAAASRSVNLARAGRCSEAYAENERAQQLAPDNTPMLNALVGVRLLCGDRRGAMSLFAKVERRPDVDRQGVYIAEVHAKLGQTDSAFAWLNRTHWGAGSRMELRVGVPLNPLRADPRYLQLLRTQHM